MTNIFIIIATFFLTMPVCVHSSDVKKNLGTEIPAHQIVRRAALDIGSGQIKMQISDVDLTINKIVNVLFSDAAFVPLREDLANSLDGKFSIAIQNKTIEAISQLIQKALPYHPEAFHAIATESFRLAKNGSDLAKKIEEKTQVGITIVTQEEEGILGFISAIQEANTDPENTIVWDFGGGSFQITTRCDGRYVIYKGKFGKIPFKEALLKIQNKEHLFSPNPISQLEAERAIEYIKGTLCDVPFEIRNKLCSADNAVLGIGIYPLWGIYSDTCYNKAHIWKELAARLNLDDEAICIKNSINDRKQQIAAYVVSNLILAYGIMDGLNISQMAYVGTQGANATGALLTPKYWKK